MTSTAVRVAQLVVPPANVRTIVGSNPNPAKTWCLKIIEEKVLTEISTTKWLDFEVFSDKEYRREVTSYNPL